MQSELHSYQIIRFIDETLDDGLKSIECVPSSWISFNNKVGSCMVRYMAPPYSFEDKRMIRELIKVAAEPPDSWLLYRVSLQGHARTHAEGLKRMKKLNYKEYAYTTATEDDGGKKSKAITDIIKKGKINDAASVENFLSRRNLSSDSESETAIANVKKRTYKDSSSESEATSSIVHTKRFQNKPKKQNTTAVIEETRKSTLQNTSLASDGKKLRSTKNQQANLSVERHLNKDLQNEKQLSAEKKVIFRDNDHLILYRTVTKLVVSMRIQTQEIQDLRHMIERSTKIRGSHMTANAFAEKYNLLEKIDSTEHFKSIDDCIRDDEEFCHDFKAALDCIADSSMKKTINAILKKFFTQKFAMNCTAVRESKKGGKKLILRGTEFYEKMFEFVKNMHSVEEVVTEKTFYQNLAICLNNAKDWHGGRRMR